MRAIDLAPVFRRILLATLAAGAAHTLSACAISLEPEEADGAIPAHDAGPSTDASACQAVTGGPNSCGATVTYLCGAPARISPGATIPSSTCASQCPTGDDAGVGGGRGTTAFSCYATGGDGGAVVLNCSYCALGRRSEGLRDPDTRLDDNALGAYLANAATLEAASVTAFERLRDELGAFGAPQSMLDALADAANEERDHAFRVGAAAQRRGAEPAQPRFERVAPRTLFDVARENAVEGCARETFGALLAAWQAERAGDPDLAAMYARLAVDEASHASLSWQMHEWFASRLDAHARDAVLRARDAAVVELFASVDSAIDPDVARATGLPDRAALRGMLLGLERELWSQRH